MNRLNKIYIIGPDQNSLFLNLFLCFKESSQIIIDSSFPQPKGIKKNQFTQFSRNNFGTKKKIRNTIISL